MGNIGLLEIPYAELAKQDGVSFIGNDLLLFDNISNIPIPTSACRTTGVILALCLRGESEYTVNTITHTVKANDAIIIPDGQVLGAFVTRPKADGIGMIMSQNFFHEVVSDIHELSSLILFSRYHPVFRLTDEELHDAMQYFELIKSKVDNVDNALRKSVTKHLIAALICELGSAITRVYSDSNRKRSRAEIIFTDFIRLVEKNYKHNRRVDWYGNQMCITAKYLSETVKNVSKRTPNEWIDNYVVAELCAQLKNTTKSIKEIAHDMNFPNQSFLGKYFKEHVGMSPMNYRKS